MMMISSSNGNNVQASSRHQQQQVDVIIKCSPCPSSSSTPPDNSNSDNGGICYNGTGAVNVSSATLNSIHSLNLLPSFPSNFHSSQNRSNNGLVGNFAQNFNNGRLPQIKSEPNSNMNSSNQHNLQYSNSSAPHLCSLCGGKIIDRYLFLVGDKYWHGTCLRCCCCDIVLSDQKSLFVKSDHIYCRDDYFRLFRSKRQCSACRVVIQPNEQIMRAGSNVYHLDCFVCQECKKSFCLGERFYLDRYNNKILCEYDYNERKVFSTLSSGDLTQLKRKLSKVDGI